MSKPWRFLLGLSCALALPAWADSPILEDVIVTATQIPESAAGLPLAWAALDENDLGTVEHVHVNESFQRIAGGWISRGNGQESLIALRSPVLTGPGSCGAFLVAQDGISLRSPGFCNVNQLFDANHEQARRVEVIKGPATALYGSGAMHGLINILSIEPAPPRHDVGVEAGPHGYRRGKYRYSGENQAQSFAIALNAASDDGYKDDSGYRQQKITLRHRYQGAAFDTDTIFAGANLEQETAGFVQGYRAFREQRNKRHNPNPEAYRDAWSVRAQSNIGIALKGNSRLTFTPYWRNNEMKFLQHFLPWKPVEENGHKSLGLNSKWRRSGALLDLIAGIDLEYTEGWLREMQSAAFSPNQPAGTHYDYQVDAALASVWSQLDWKASNRLKLLAGLRHDYTNYDYNTHAEPGPACEATASACRFYRPAGRSDDFNSWSANLGLLLDLNETHSLYLRGSRGFRTPQTTELYRLQAGQQSAALDAVEIDSLDLGIRGGSGDFRYELGSYYMAKDKVIFQDSNRHNVSGARTLHYGLDISLRWSLPHDFDLGLDANVARHEYDSNIQLVDSRGGIKGNDIDTAPRGFGSMRLGWQIHPRHRLEFEWVHMGRYYLEPDNLHRYGGHQLLNLRLYNDLGPRLSVAFRVTNLTDEDYAERADFGFGNYRYFVGEPRSLYVQLSYRLN